MFQKSFKLPLSLVISISWVWASQAAVAGEEPRSISTLEELQAELTEEKTQLENAVLRATHPKWLGVESPLTSVDPIQPLLDRVASNAKIANDFLQTPIESILKAKLSAEEAKKETALGGAIYQSVASQKMSVLLQVFGNLQYRATIQIALGIKPDFYTIEMTVPIYRELSDLMNDLSSSFPELTDWAIGKISNGIELRLMEGSSPQGPGKVQFSLDPQFETNTQMTLRSLKWSDKNASGIMKQTLGLTLLQNLSKIYLYQGHGTEGPLQLPEATTNKFEKLGVSNVTQVLKNDYTAGAETSYRFGLTQVVDEKMGLPDDPNLAASLPLKDGRLEENGIEVVNRIFANSLWDVLNPNGKGTVNERVYDLESWLKSLENVLFRACYFHALWSFPFPLAAMYENQRVASLAEVMAESLLCVHRNGVQVLASELKEATLDYDEVAGADRAFDFLEKKSEEWKETFLTSKYTVLFLKNLADVKRVRDRSKNAATFQTLWLDALTNRAKIEFGELQDIHNDLNLYWKSLFEALKPDLILTPESSKLAGYEFEVERKIFEAELSALAEQNDPTNIRNAYWQKILAILGECFEGFPKGLTPGYLLKPELGELPPDTIDWVAIQKGISSCEYSPRGDLKKSIQGIPELEKAFERSIQSREYFFRQWIELGKMIGIGRVDYKTKKWNPKKISELFLTTDQLERYEEAAKKEVRDQHHILGVEVVGTDDQGRLSGKEELGQILSRLDSTKNRDEIKSLVNQGLEQTKVAIENALDAFVDADELDDWVNLAGTSKHIGSLLKQFPAYDAEWQGVIERYYGPGFLENGAHLAERTMSHAFYPWIAQMLLKTTLRFTRANPVTAGLTALSNAADPYISGLMATFWVAILPALTTEPLQLIFEEPELVDTAKNLYQVSPDDNSTSFYSSTDLDGVVQGHRAHWMGWGAARVMDVVMIGGIGLVASIPTKIALKKLIAIEKKAPEMFKRAGFTDAAYYQWSEEVILEVSQAKRHEIIERIRASRYKKFKDGPKNPDRSKLSATERAEAKLQQQLQQELLEHLMAREWLLTQVREMREYWAKFGTHYQYHFRRLGLEPGDWSPEKIGEALKRADILFTNKQITLAELKIRKEVATELAKVLRQEGQKLRKSYLAVSNVNKEFETMLLETEGYGEKALRQMKWTRRTGWIFARSKWKPAWIQEGLKNLTAQAQRVHEDFFNNSAVRKLTVEAMQGTDELNYAAPWNYVYDPKIQKDEQRKLTVIKTNINGKETAVGVYSPRSYWDGFSTWDEPQ